MFTKCLRWNPVRPVALFSCLLAAALVSTSVVSQAQQPSSAPMRGINIMDMGIAADHVPGIYGRNYTKPSLEALQELARRGHEVVRIPMLWERMQPELGGPLNPEYLGYLLEVLRDADKAGLKVIVDMHNYGRYLTVRTPPVVRYRFGDAQGPTQAQYADVWVKIARAIKADPQAYRAVYAYDLMNEPYDLPSVPGTFSVKAPVSSFDNGVDGWKTNAANATIEQTTRDGKGALKVTVQPVAGSGLVFNQSLQGQAQPLVASNGPNLQVKGFVPETTSGTVKARMWIIDSQWKGAPSQIVTLTKGQPFELNFEPPAATWNDNRGIGFDFIVDNSDGKAPLVFFIDDVNQGALGGGLTPQQVWEAYSQAAVAGLRADKDATLLMVEGYHFSSASMWPTNHPRAWINDPLNNTMYHAHLYMDNDSSGTYKKSHAEEMALSKEQGHANVGARSVARIKNFLDWVNKHNTRGYVGEFGWPNSHYIGEADGKEWDIEGARVLTYLDNNKVGYTLWGTGSWLSPTDNELNAYTLPPGRPFQALTPALVLEKHLQKKP